MTQEELTAKFIERANQVHNFRYTYPNTVYVNANSKVKIVCPIHGEFEQPAKHHLAGHGCKECGRNIAKTKTTLDAEVFFKKANEVHKGRYDYSESVYVNNKTPIRIICPKHGPFYQLPNNHLRYGCRDCAAEKRGEAKRKEFIDYITAKDIISELGIKSKGDFITFAKNHKDILEQYNIPVTPDTVYKTRGEWISWPDFFNNERRLTEWATFEVAKDFARRLGFTCKEEWQNYVRNNEIPHNIPKSPECVYNGKGWTCYADFLGYAKKEIVTYEEAKSIINNLEIKSVSEYEAITPEEKTRLGLPSCPQHFYGEWDKNGAWPGFLGRCNKFTKQYKLAWLKRVDVEQMHPHQLIELAMSKVIPEEFKTLAYANGNTTHLRGIVNSLISVYENNESDSDIEREVERIEQREQEQLNNEAHRNEVDNGLLELVLQPTNSQANTSVENEEQQNYVLPSASLSRFRIYDTLDNLKPGDKASEFITLDEYARIWNLVLAANEDGKADEEYERIKNMECGQFSAYVRDRFIYEYEIVTKIKEDPDYKFHVDGKPCPLSLMQKLMAYKMSVNDCYGNWCGTGAGKTNAFLFSTRYVGAKTTVVITPNGVVNSLVSAIKIIYPNSNIVVPQKPDDIKTYSKDRYTYIIFNYEKFQDPHRAKSFINKLLETNTIDFVCLDEVHNIKVRDINKASNRSKYIGSFLVAARKQNPNMKTLAMTATPCPNSLSEVRSILEALTGKKYPEIGNRTGIDNVHNAYKALVLLGFRYVPKYPMVIKERTVEIDCTDDAELITELRNRDNNNNDIAFILANRKLDVLKDELKDGTIVYSNWVDGMASMLEDKIRSWGYSVECYNGRSGGKKERGNIFKAFLKKKINVLVCSQPISTGVDKLQKRCNKMIFISLPWTDVEYTQTKGRIYRQGSVFKEVEFVIPQVTIRQNNGKVWSYDRGLLGLIEGKHSLAAAVLDGYIQESYRINHERLKQLAIEALEAGLEEVQVERPDIDVDVDLTETEEQRKIRRENYVSEIHRMANTSNHRTMHKYFAEHPEVFNKYHDSRDTDELAKHTIVPIAEFINSHYSNKKIADLGCGVNMLRTLVKNGNTVTGFDLQQYYGDQNVVVADIANLRGIVKDREYDVAVFSMSLWSLDYEDYFNEAYRILSKNGVVFVVEPASKFGEGSKFGTEDDFIDMVQSYGFSRLGDVKNHEGFKLFRFEKED